MSDISATYGDYAGQAAAALKKRANQTIANQQAVFYGQQRGQRALEDLARKFQQGWNPTLSSFSRRGLRNSGITQNALLDYSKNYQRNVDAQTAANASEMNTLAQQEVTNEDELQKYLADLRFQKARDILNTANTISSLGAFGG